MFKKDGIHDGKNTAKYKAKKAVQLNLKINLK